MYILFYLQMAFDNRGMRPSVSQNKIKANIFSEEEYNLMLQNKCLKRLVEGQATTNWKQALQQLSMVYPDRINPHL